MWESTSFILRRSLLSDSLNLALYQGNVLLGHQIGVDYRALGLRFGLLFGKAGFLQLLGISQRAKWSAHKVSAPWLEDAPADSSFRRIAGPASETLVRSNFPSR
jgi:hypothetical protein